MVLRDGIRSVGLAPSRQGNSIILPKWCSGGNPECRSRIPFPGLRRLRRRGGAPVGTLSGGRDSWRAPTPSPIRSGAPVRRRSVGRQWRSSGGTRCRPRSGAPVGPRSVGRAAPYMAPEWCSGRNPECWIVDDASQFMTVVPRWCFGRNPECWRVRDRARARGCRGRSGAPNEIRSAGRASPHSH